MNQHAHFARPSRVQWPLSPALRGIFLPFGLFRSTLGAALLFSEADLPQSRTWIAPLLRRRLSPAASTGRDKFLIAGDFSTQFSPR